MFLPAVGPGSPAESQRDVLRFRFIAPASLNPGRRDDRTALARVIHGAPRKNTDQIRHTKHRGRWSSCRACSMSSVAKPSIVVTLAPGAYVRNGLVLLVRGRTCS